MNTMKDYVDNDKDQFMEYHTLSLTFTKRETLDDRCNQIAQEVCDGNSHVICGWHECVSLILGYSM